MNYDHPPVLLSPGFIKGLQILRLVDFKQYDIKKAGKTSDENLESSGVEGVGSLL